jgi:GT2 family glycosyltransferase
MKFSLVMTTLGRSEEVKSFLESLRLQTYNDYELILVDQNEDNRVDKKLKLISDESFKEKIKYFKMAEVGISKGRNLGLRYITGTIIAFPDDDCEYPDNLLENVCGVFQSNPELVVLTGRCLDKGTFKRSAQRSPHRKCFINSMNIFKTISSTTLFIRRVSETDIFFDTDLGINSRFGAAEDNDLVYRLLREGHKGIFDPSMIVYHPVKDSKDAGRLAEGTISKLYKFNTGCGAFFRKSLRNNFDFFLFLHSIETIILKPVIGLLLNLFDDSQRKLFVIKLKGRLNGFWEYTPSGKT